MKIEIISREAIKPSIPTPSHLRTFSLSLIDQPIPLTFYIPIILYYNNSTNIKQSQISDILKTSLSSTLYLYYPLAGRMEGDAFVNCNDQGVEYSEARVDCTLLDIVRAPCVEELSTLTPSTTNRSKGASDVQVSIQCNFFVCGGIAMGILFSHRIGDCCTLTSFLQTWSKITKGEEILENPGFVSSTIFPPRDPSGFMFTTRGGVPENGFVTKRFIFSSQNIVALREKVSIQAPTLSKPTRVELITALIWKCGMNANRGKGYISSVATLPVNLRPRMEPSLPESSFGNIFRTAFGYGNFEMDLDTLIEILRKGIGVFDMDGIKKFQSDGYRVIVEAREKVLEMNSSKEVLWLKFGVWCRFPIYEVDFGWGKPVWVTCAKSDSKNETILLDSRCGEGIEAWVTMEDEDMKAFEQDVELLAFASLG